MATAQEADFFGGGTLAPVAGKAPAKTPEELAAEKQGEAIRRQRETAPLNQNTSYWTGGDSRTPTEALLGGGYQDDGKGGIARVKGGSNRTLGDLASDLWGVPAKVATAPINATLGQLPVVGNTVKGATNAIVSGGAAPIKELVDHPGRSLLTLGANTGVAAFDSVADDFGTGLYRDISGNDRAKFDLPGTPGQLWEPKHPLVDYGDGTSLNQPGIRDIGEAIGDGAQAAGKAVYDGAKWAGGQIAAGADAVGDYFDFDRGAGGAGGGGLGGGGAAGGALGGAMTQAGNVRQKGNDVLSGAQTPGGSDAAQQDVLDQAMGFMGGPRAQQGVMDKAGAFSPTAQQGQLAKTNAYAPTAQAGVQGAAQDFQTGPRRSEGALNDVQSFQQGPRAQDSARAGAQSFQQGPRAQDNVMGGLDQFLAQDETPSKAQLLLDKASQDTMGDNLALARSGRARDAGSQARALQVAQAENAASGVDNARNASLLKAQETADFRQQQLGALTQKGNLASTLDAGTLQAMGIDADLAQGLDKGSLEALGLGSSLSQGMDKDTLASLGLQGDMAQGQDANRLGALGVGADLSKGIDSTKLGAMDLEGQMASGLDKDTLAALGLSGDMASNMRNAGVQERGQTLDYSKGMEQVGAQLEGDVLKTIPQLEQIRHDDQYELLPEEKLKLALAGAGGDILSTFF